MNFEEIIELFADFVKDLNQSKIKSVYNLKIVQRQEELRLRKESIKKLLRKS